MSNIIKLVIVLPSSFSFQRVNMSPATTPTFRHSNRDPIWHSARASRSSRTSESKRYRRSAYISRRKHSPNGWTRFWSRLVEILFCLASSSADGQLSSLIRHSVCFITGENGGRRPFRGLGRRNQTAEAARDHLRREAGEAQQRSHASPQDWKLEQKFGVPAYKSEFRDWVFMHGIFNQRASSWLLSCDKNVLSFRAHL